MLLAAVAAGVPDIPRTKGLTPLASFTPAFAATGFRINLPLSLYNPAFWITLLSRIIPAAPLPTDFPLPGTVKASVQFRDVGTILQTDAYVIVTIKHDFLPISTLCDNQEKLIPNINDLNIARYYGSAFDHQTQHHILQLTIDEVQTHLEDICSHFAALFQYSPLQSSPTRVTRGVISAATAISTGIAVISNIVGWIHQVYQAHLINKRFQVQETASDHLAHQVDQTITSLTELSQVFTTTTALKKMEASFTHIRANLLELRSYLDRITIGIALLQQEKLCPEIVPILTLHKILAETERIANQNFLHPAAKAPMELLHLPATYATNGLTLSIVFAIPLTSKVLTLEQFLQAPIVTTNSDGSHSLMEILPSKDFIAQDTKSSSYAALDLADLQSCLKIGRNYMCAGMPVYTEAEETCISALRDKDATAVSRQCKFKESDKELFLTQRAAGQYALATANEQVVNIHCTDGSNTDRHFNPGQHLLALNQGCTARTDTVVIHRPQDNLASITVEGDLDIKVQAIRASALTPAEIVRELQLAANSPNFPSNNTKITAALSKFSGNLKTSVISKLTAHLYKATLFIGICLAITGLLALIAIGIFCKLRKDSLATYRAAKEEMRTDIERIQLPQAPQIPHNPLPALMPPSAPQPAPAFIRSRY